MYPLPTAFAPLAPVAINLELPHAGPIQVVPRRNCIGISSRPVNVRITTAVDALFVLMPRGGQIWTRSSDAMHEHGCKTFHLKAMPSSLVPAPEKAPGKSLRDKLRKWNAKPALGVPQLHFNCAAVLLIKVVKRRDDGDVQ